MNFINGMTVLLVYQLVGEISVQWMHLPVPGPVIGMMLLFLTLLGRQAVWGKPIAPFLKFTTDSLLGHLSLLFVPAGVGVIIHFDRIVDEWMPISIALILSTVITMTATAVIMQISHRILVKRFRPHV